MSFSSALRSGKSPLREQSVDLRQQERDVLGSNDEGGEESQDVVPRLRRQDGTSLEALHDRGDRSAKLDADHEADPANFADRGGVLPCEPSQAFLQNLASLLDRLEEARTREAVENREGGCCPNGVAAK